LTEVGYFTPDYHKDATLKEGQIGYLVTGQKSVRDAQIGDTVVLGKRDDKTQEYGIPGFKKVTPFVYA
jgi:GTP-binding protein LepA